MRMLPELVSHYEMRKNQVSEYAKVFPVVGDISLIGAWKSSLSSSLLFRIIDFIAVSVGDIRALDDIETPCRCHEWAFAHLWIPFMAKSQKQNYMWWSFLEPVETMFASCERGWSFLDRQPIRISHGTITGHHAIPSSIIGQCNQLLKDMFKYPYISHRSFSGYPFIQYAGSPYFRTTQAYPKMINA